MKFEGVEVRTVTRQKADLGTDLFHAASTGQIRKKSLEPSLTMKVVKSTVSYHDESAAGGRAHRQVVVAHTLRQKSDP